MPGVLLELAKIHNRRFLITPSVSLFSQFYRQSRGAQKARVLSQPTTQNGICLDMTLSGRVQTLLLPLQSLRLRALTSLLLLTMRRKVLLALYRGIVLLHAEQRTRAKTCCKFFPNPSNGFESHTRPRRRYG